MARRPPRGRGRARRLASTVLRRRPNAAPECVFDDARRTPGCSRSSTSAARSSEQPVRVKVQVTGPLTLGVALARRRRARAARVPARRRGHARVVGRARGARRTRGCPDAGSCCSSTSPRWWHGAAATRRSIASRRSTCCRARSPRSTASPACTCAVTATSALALEAGPAGARRRGERRRSCSDTVALAASSTATAGSRGARCRPTGRSANRPTRTGVVLATRVVRAHAPRVRSGAAPHRGMITPACGLAGYGASQAERVLGIARELAARVHDQAVAARLTLGA